jgi:hypothetical protein
MTTLALYHMTGCGACEAFMPQWDDKKNGIKGGVKIESKYTTVKEIEDANPNHTFVGGELEQLLEYKKNIFGYPTIVKKKGETISEYDKERDIGMIKSWAKTTTGGRRFKAVYRKKYGHKSFKKHKTQFRKKNGSQTKKNSRWFNFFGF